MVQMSCRIVGSSIGMPDIHSGYGFAVGNVAAFDMDDPASVVSPGGVGLDINCGVRLLRSGGTIPLSLRPQMCTMTYPVASS